MKKFLWLFLAPASAASLLAQSPAPLAPAVPEVTLLDPAEPDVPLFPAVPD